MAPSPAPALDGDPLYPTVFHLRIVAEAGVAETQALGKALSGIEVTDPLRPGRASSAGRYCTWQVSVRLRDRDEHVRLDTALRAVSGVKCVL